VSTKARVCSWIFLQFVRSQTIAIVLTKTGMIIAIYARVATRLGGESQPGGRSTSAQFALQNFLVEVRRWHAIGAGRTSRGADGRFFNFYLINLVILRRPIPAMLPLQRLCSVTAPTATTPTQAMGGQLAAADHRAVCVRDQVDSRALGHGRRCWEDQCLFLWHDVQELHR
jgi:hypothetical protein